jgi:hypothetical protein
VPEGGFVRYRLVIDEETGDFRGAGVVLPGEFGSVNAGDDRWFNSMVIGADGSLSQSNNLVGAINQTVLGGTVFWDTQLVYNFDPHFLGLLFQVEEGVSQVRPQGGEALPLVKTQDALRGDVLYTYFFSKVFGPYVRAAAETQLFPTDVLMTTDTAVVERRPGRSPPVRKRFEANETYRVAGVFEPAILRQGAGLNSRLVNTRLLTFNLRLGLGLRENLYGGALVLDDNPDTVELEYTLIRSFQQEGIESTIIANARLPGWVVYSTDLEFFADFVALNRPSIEWTNALTARLTENMSVRYAAHVDFLPQVVEQVQFEQSVLLRASWAVF